MTTVITRDLYDPCHTFDLLQVSAQMCLNLGSISPYLLHSFLKVSVKHLETLDNQQMALFLQVLNQLTSGLGDIKASNSIAV